MINPEIRETRELNLHPPQRRTLTSRQKEMIRARDGYTCQFPEPHVCNAHEQTCHVHHIIPFGVVTEYMGKSAAVADHPGNLITVCEEIHIGGRRNARQRILHPDMPEVRRAYGQGNKNAYQEMHDKRQHMMRRGQLYHRSDKDSEMRMIAHMNIMLGEENGTFSMEAFKNAGKRTRRTGPERKSA